VVFRVLWLRSLAAKLKDHRLKPGGVYSGMFPKAMLSAKPGANGCNEIAQNRHEISHQSVTSWGCLVSNLLKEVGVTEARRALSLRLQIVPRGIFEFMKNVRTKLLTIVAILALGVVPAMGQRNRGMVITNPQLGKQVRHELVTLPYYGVFDNLAYNIDGSTVTLYGQVLRPTTRSDAERRVKRLGGVSRVVNNIQVLPLSGFDDNIRRATYRSLARTAGLYRYLQGTNPSIHIVVDRGHVTLEGVVSNSGDKTLANMAARQVPGAFSVTNNLKVEGNVG